MNLVCTVERVRILHQIDIVARAPKDYRAIAVKSLNIHVQLNHAKMVARVPSRYDLQNAIFSLDFSAL